MFEKFIKSAISPFIWQYRALEPIRTMMGHRRINKTNRTRRGITENRASEINRFFLPKDPQTNVLISGGDNRIRSQTINAIVYAAAVNNIPTVVVHAANRELEKMLQMTFANSGRLSVININHPQYEPFEGLSDHEISRLILESSPKDIDLKPNAKYYIDGMIAYLQAVSKRPSLNAFSKCPHADLFNRIDGLVSKGTITDIQGQEIKSKLMQGQSEISKLESYFQSLEYQFEYILNRKTSQSQISITRAIDYSEVIVIDITSNVNKLLLNILVTQIRFAVGKGKQVSFIADELSTESNELFSSFIRLHDDHCKLTVCSRDLFTMCGGDEKVFNTILGNSEKIVLFAHSLGASAAKWAEAIGYYDKTETSNSYSKGFSRQRPFQLYPSSNSTNTTNLNIKREHIVKPEEINRMQPNEVYIFDNITKQLLHTRLQDSK